jgi:hypothetical protein
MEEFALSILDPTLASHSAEGFGRPELIFAEFAQMGEAAARSAAGGLAPI